MKIPYVPSYVRDFNSKIILCTQYFLLLALCLVPCQAVFSQDSLPSILAKSNHDAANNWLPDKIISKKDSVYFGRLFEPRGHRILHGIGQSEKIFKEYSRHFPASPPILFMTYNSLWVRKRDILRLKKELENYAPNFIIPQIGVGLPNWKGIDTVQVKELAEKFAENLSFLQGPAFIRLGYEFNGEWNRYNPEDYKRCYRIVVKAIREKVTFPIAFVWCYAVEGMYQNWEDYYPGDEWVDWWGIDLFSPEHFSAGNTKDFIQKANVKHYPVMIGESSPRWVSAQRGDYSWRTWFKQLIKLFAYYPNIKAFCYITYDWAEYYGPVSALHDWGDARIWRDSVVSARWKKTMEDPAFIHAQTKESLQKLINLERK